MSIAQAEIEYLVQEYPDVPRAVIEEEHARANITDAKQWSLLLDKLSRVPLPHDVGNVGAKNVDVGAKNVDFGAKNVEKPVDNHILSQTGDLFSSKSNLAHCVSADGAMGKGIAKLFVQKFGQGLKKDVTAADPHVGSVVASIAGSIYVYNLVTKAKYFEKPTLESVRAALEEMKVHAVNHKVKQIDMPQIGAGLDKLYWPDVMQVIQEVFDPDCGIRICIWQLPKKST